MELADSMIKDCKLLWNEPPRPPASWPKKNKFEY